MRVWDSAAPYELVFETKGLGAEVMDLSWSPDGKLIALCGGGAGQIVKVISAASGSSGSAMAGPTKVRAACLV